MLGPKRRPGTRFFRYVLVGRDPAGIQNRPKTDSKTGPKIDSIFDPFFDWFWILEWIKKRHQHLPKIELKYIKSVSAC